MRYLLFISLALIGCKDQGNTPAGPEAIDQVSLVVLGTFQDGGSPHAGCKKDCCKDLFKDPDKDRMVVSLGLIDPGHKQSWLFEATPDISRQMKLLKELGNSESETPAGIFLTHAHTGHYTGLMHLGREAMNASSVPVYAMPRMKRFLEKNGPWNQLVTLNNISLNKLENEKEQKLNESISVKPIRVPHRDEYSETVGYLIKGPAKVALFIPDIDKWSKWELDIREAIRKVDYAFLDATFYDSTELNNRNMVEIPHPFVIESMELFKDLSKEEKARIIFIHFNHTNKLADPNSKEYSEVIRQGFKVASFGQVFKLE